MCFKTPITSFLPGPLRKRWALAPGCWAWRLKRFGSGSRKPWKPSIWKDMKTREPFALTKGERQRLAVASMLAARPWLLILDEPTTGLDYGHQRGLLEMLNRLNQQGHTILIVTHHLWVAVEYCRRCVVLKEGRIWLEGATRTVFRQETHLKEASLVPPPIVQLSNRLDLQGLIPTTLAREIMS